MINQSAYLPLEKKIISNKNRFKLFKKDLVEINKDFKKSNLLVTGAAGSIGSQFVKDIIRFNFKFNTLILLDKNENQLTDLNRELLLLNNFKKKKIYFICTDLTFLNLDSLLVSKKITHYLNFAAIKHVRSEENVESIKYMIKTNAMSFLPKKKHRLKKIFSVSTDKTVNPSSILGITKHIMEINLSKFSKNKNLFVSSARFANVSFSNGSILKYVVDRILSKKPFGIPNKIRRFFITHEEASSLCFKALLNNNNKKIVVPNPKSLNKDFLIKDLVDKITKYYGYNAKFKKGYIKNAITKKDYNILLTPPNTHGQKLHEELLSKNEKIYQFNDATYISTDLPSYKNNLEVKIFSASSIVEIKKILKQKFKNYNFSNKVLKVSKTI